MVSNQHIRRFFFDFKLLTNNRTTVPWSVGLLFWVILLTQRDAFVEKSIVVSWFVWQEETIERQYKRDRLSPPMLLVGAERVKRVPRSTSIQCFDICIFFITRPEI
jgi:hypothetical protein